MQKKDLYRELGLKKNCDNDEIRKAYKKLALQWHPDKNRDRIEEATQKFQSISEAYAILSDEKKRAHYDRFGIIDEGDFDFEEFMHDFNFDDLFGAMMFDMNMMFDLMGLASKGGKLNGRRMKNMEKKVQKKYEDQAQRMFEKMTKGVFDDFDTAFGYGKKPKKAPKKQADSDDEGWETEEEGTDDEKAKGKLKNNEEDNSEDYEDCSDDDEDEEEEPRIANGKNKQSNGEKKTAQNDSSEEDEDEKEQAMYEQLQEQYLKDVYHNHGEKKDMNAWLNDMVEFSSKYDEELIKQPAQTN